MPDSLTQLANYDITTLSLRPGDFYSAVDSCCPMGSIPDNLHDTIQGVAQRCVENFPAPTLGRVIFELGGVLRRVCSDQQDLAATQLSKSQAVDISASAMLPVRIKNIVETAFVAVLRKAYPTASAGRTTLEEIGAVLRITIADPNLRQRGERS